MTADPRQPSWGEVLDTVLTSRLRSVHTAMVGEMVSYSPATQTAVVRLGVELEATAGVWEAVPPMEDVPVVWPGAWTAGDSCLVVFCEESFAKWWDTGAIEQPEVLRRHGLHAVCIPVVARAGQPVQRVALEPGVAAVLGDFVTAVDTVVKALLPAGLPTEPKTAFAAAVTALQVRVAAGEMAAQKVMAR